MFPPFKLERSSATHHEILAPPSLSIGARPIRERRSVYAGRVRWNGCRSRLHATVSPVWSHLHALGQWSLTNLARAGLWPGTDVIHHRNRRPAGSAALYDRHSQPIDFLQRSPRRPLGWSRIRAREGEQFMRNQRALCRSPVRQPRQLTARGSTLGRLLPGYGAL